MSSKKTKILNKFDNFIKAINKYFSIIAGLLILIMSVAVFIDVIKRYFFNNPSTWILDFAALSLVFVVFLSFAPALESGSHVSVDLFKEKASGKVQKILEFIVFGLTLLFGLIFLWKTLDYTIQVAEDNVSSNSNIRIPLKYIYFIAPVGFLQFLLTTLNIYLNTITKNNV